VAGVTHDANEQSFCPDGVELIDETGMLDRVHASAPARQSVAWTLDDEVNVLCALLVMR